MSFAVQTSEYNTQSGDLPISGVHPIMLVKSALAGEGGGCTAAPFQPYYMVYHHVES